MWMMISLFVLFLKKEVKKIQDKDSVLLLSFFKKEIKKDAKKDDDEL